MTGPMKNEERSENVEPEIDPSLPRKNKTDSTDERTTSQKAGLRQRIEECPSDRVKEVLLDSLNKENNTSDTNG